MRNLRDISDLQINKKKRRKIFGSKAKNVPNDMGKLIKLEEFPQEK